MWIRYFHYLLLLLLRPMCMIRGLLLQSHQVISWSTDRHVKCVNETKPCLGKGYDFEEIEVCKPIKDIYRIFGIEQKQSVIKINDGNNHCHAAKRGWVVEKNRLLAQQVQKAFSWVRKEVRKLFCGSRSMFRLLYIYLQENNFWDRL